MILSVHRPETLLATPYEGLERAPPTRVLSVRGHATPHVYFERGWGGEGSKVVSS
jgi:hypothetical protein